MDGSCKGQHKADFVRSACLFMHGGVWSDVGQVLLRTFDTICWNILEDESRPERVFAPQWVGKPMVPLVLNYFVAARKGDPFIKRW